MVIGEDLGNKRRSFTLQAGTALDFVPADQKRGRIGLALWSSSLEDAKPQCFKLRVDIR